jgi:putative transposase
MKSYLPLQPGLYYHIFNRGNNGEDLFREERNYLFFLKLYGKYILPIADTYAYCLLKNHFHFLVRIKNEEEIVSFRDSEGKNGLFLKNENHFNPSKYFSNMYNAYSKAINKRYNRTGSLFEKPFNRIQVNKDAYFSR